jgi:hypothetical protein
MVYGPIQPNPLMAARHQDRCQIGRIRQEILTVREHDKGGRMKRIAKEDFAQEKKNVGRLIGALTLGMALVLSLAAPARVNAATVTYHACVNNSSGDIIIVTG